MNDELSPDLGAYLTWAVDSSVVAFYHIVLVCKLVRDLLVKDSKYCCTKVGIAVSQRSKHGLRLACQHQETYV